MDFSWFGITVIDVGIFTIGVFGFAWLYRQNNALRKENAVLKQAIADLKLEHEEVMTSLKLEHAQDIATLKAEHQTELDALNEVNRRLHARVDALEEENRALQQRFNFLSGQYAETQATHDKLFVMLDRILGTVAGK